MIDLSAEYYYYNNALRLVKEIAVQQEMCERIVSKRKFLDKINNKKCCLINGIYSSREYESIVQIYGNNIFHREMCLHMKDFLVECDTTINDVQIVSLIAKISKNWSKLSSREIKPFCPYVYLNGISQERLVGLKKNYNMKIYGYGMDMIF
ncbi:MAG: hypothetical protein ACLRMN_10995 [Mediterraneibacter gnavus]